MQLVGQSPTRFEAAATISLCVLSFAVVVQMGLLSTCSLLMLGNDAMYTWLSTTGLVISMAAVCVSFERWKALGNYLLAAVVVCFTVKGNAHVTEAAKSCCSCNGDVLSRPVASCVGSSTTCLGFSPSVVGYEQ